MNDAILKWAQVNKMTVNTSQKKEIVFRRPNPRLHVNVMPLLSIEQVNEVKPPKVIFYNNLRFNLQVNYLLKIGSPRSNLIRRLRDQGLAN
jgi:hypothetical protein